MGDISSTIQNATAAVQRSNVDSTRFESIRAAQRQMVQDPASWPYRQSEKIQVGGALNLGQGMGQYLPLILLAGIVFFIVLKK